MRRHGVLELLLVLPDGSKSLVPAGWTDADRSGVDGGTTAATLGAVQAHAPPPASAIPRTVISKFTSVTVDPVHFTYWSGAWLVTTPEERTRCPSSP